MSCNEQEGERVDIAREVEPVSPEPVRDLARMMSGTADGGYDGGDDE